VVGKAGGIHFSKGNRQEEKKCGSTGCFLSLGRRPPRIQRNVILVRSLWYPLHGSRQYVIYIGPTQLVLQNYIEKFKLLQFPFIKVTPPMLQMLCAHVLGNLLVSAANLHTSEIHSRLKSHSVVSKKSRPLRRN
jgi:hypothetical protein